MQGIRQLTEYGGIIFPSNVRGEYKRASEFGCRQRIADVFIVRIASM